MRLTTIAELDKHQKLHLLPQWANPPPLLEQSANGQMDRGDAMAVLL